MVLPEKGEGEERAGSGAARTQRAARTEKSNFMENV
jgi:hypothetical protein